MKNLLKIILPIMFLSCNNESETVETFIETEASFSNLKESNWTENNWIRKEENLKMIHETFKKFGYDRLQELIYKDENQLIIGDIYIKKNYRNLIDSLEFSYKNREKSSKYYKEFWTRREREDNDSIVFNIISDIRNYNKNEIQVNENKVNDTLYNLLNIEFGEEKIDQETAKNNFQILKNYGFHQSAYNLLFERPEYSNINLERDEMKETLIHSDSYQNPWLIDNSK